jgi:RNA polymerase sigma-70 factor, ECF subfamily
MAIGGGFPDVLAAAQLGAEWAWRVIYRDLSPTVIGYLRLHSVLEPEDLTGEVFVQVVRGLRDFVGDEAQFRSWIFVIAHHRILDERRRRSRKPFESAEPESIAQHGPAGNSEDEALARLLIGEIKQALATLSQGQREVLLLRIVGGLTLEETAAAVGKRLGSVKALQRRGFAAIRRNGIVQIPTPVTGELAADIA